MPRVRLGRVVTPAAVIREGWKRSPQPRRGQKSRASHSPLYIHSLHLLFFLSLSLNLISPSPFLSLSLSINLISPSPFLSLSLSLSLCYSVSLCLPFCPLSFSLF